MDDILPFFQNNWHKIIVVILALAQIWKFFIEYIKPTIKSNKNTNSIILPKEGCIITIKPLEKD
jgi:hypothetical protein